MKYFDTFVNLSLIYVTYIFIVEFADELAENNSEYISNKTDGEMLIMINDIISIYVLSNC